MNQKIYRAGRSWQNGIKGGTTIPIVCQWSGWNFLVSAKLSCTCLYCNYIDYMLQHGGGQEPGRGVWKQFLDCLGVLSWKPLQDCTCVDGHAILELPNETGEHRMRSNGRDTWKKMRKEYTLASTCKYHMTGENSKGNFLSGSIRLISPNRAVESNTALQERSEKSRTRRGIMTS